MVKTLLWSISAFYLLHGRVVLALNNGLASKPPMGWKPWNAFQGNIYDALIRTQIDALTSKSRTVDGVPTSLADLGYLRMGIDDNWQACKTGWQGSFHAQDGTPLVNHSRFPNIKDLVTYGHSKGVLMGWYTINCMCMDTYIIQRNTEDRNWTERVYAKEAQLILEADFDGVKIDNCGDDQGIGFELIMKHLNASGKPILVEDCNQGNGHGPPRGLPSDPHGWCPGNFFRTGHDIVADFAVTMDHLQETIPYQDLTAPISRPGCWAHPDMLEVGNFQGPDNLTQGRTHFGAWCIVSAPLYLSFDLTNKSNVDAVWEIISNKEAIAVNQAWYGHPGRLVKDGGSYQLWAKKLADGAQAALVINRNGTAALHDVTVSLESLGTELGRGATAWDVWAKKPVPLTDTTWRVPPLQAYDSAFLIFKPLGVQEVITNIVL